MSAGIRPSSDKPTGDYYFQPWWAKEIIRMIQIMERTDLTVLSEKDITALTKAAQTFVTLFPERH